MFSHGQSFGCSPSRLPKMANRTGGITRMTNRTWGIVVILCGVLLAALPTFAHHSLNSEFQMGKPTALKGTLMKVEWDNPHVYWYLDAKDAGGSVVRWSVRSEERRVGREL